MKHIFIRELGLLITIALITGIIGVLGVWYTWNNQNVDDTLHDIFFEILPDMSDITTPIPNYIYLAQFVIGILSFKNEKKLQLLAQYLFIQCIMSCVRGITVSVTILPNIHVYDYCKEKQTSFFEVMANLIQYGTCGDYMWSGHTASAFLLYMFVHRHKTKYWYEIVSGILLGVMVLFLLLQRWHYSIDIIIALIVNWFAFKFYKRYEKDPDELRLYFTSFKWSNLKTLCSNKRRARRNMGPEKQGYYNINF